MLRRLIDAQPRRSRARPWLSRIRNAGSEGSLPIQWTVFEAPSSCSTPGDIPWASVAPAAGSTDGGTASTVSVALDSTVVRPGQHLALRRERRAGHAARRAALSFDVQYVFSGFFGSVANAPTLNAVKAGNGINVVFSLAGDWGPGVFASGHPQSQRIDCSTRVTQEPATPTSPRRSVTYDATTDRYKYVWETNAAWDGTCRQFLLKLNDGTPARVAYFSFSK